MFGKFDPTSAELREDINLTQIDVARILVGDTCMDGPPNDGDVHHDDPVMQTAHKVMRNVRSVHFANR